jgi:hypothetical protein
MRLEEYPDHLLENLGELYGVIKTLTPSTGKTAQDSLLEIRASIEELYAVARSGKTDSRMPVVRALVMLAARCLVEASQLGARDEHEVKQWADVSKLEPTPAKPAGKRQGKKVATTAA